ncbi:hypothetical protein P8452_06675 [Trifolium repens]|nr:hypothetical protein P8452_06675 [Trifolium repens]
MNLHLHFPRDRHELELDFKRFWDEFRSSSSEKEKEAASNWSIDAFCRLVKQQANIAQLVTVCEPILHLFE